MNGFNTRAVNPTGEPEDGYKTLRPPLYDSVAFEFESSKDIQLAFEGRKSAFAYSRVSNPTVAEFENRIKDLSGSIGVLALSSGMAAISNTVLALAGTGTNGVIAKTLFGNSVSLFKETFGPWGFESRFVDITDQEAVESAIDKNTRFIFLEIISNPQMEVANIRKVVEIGNKYGGILTFDLNDKETAFRFMDELKLIRRATNLNDNKSLIIHPASTIFSEYSELECEEMGVREALIRLSVGIEESDDLIEDINQALEGI